MIITRTPYRVSLFGGGTDYPAWYRKNGGAVLSTTIDKYCWITARYLPPFFEHKHRIVYGWIETVRDTKQINHPAVRECFNYMDVEQGLEIHHDGDVPARSGLGASSSFTVGLLNALYELNGIHVDKMTLAKDAIHVEQDMIMEAVGSQDQVAAAFGGFNEVSFDGDDIKVQSIKTSPVLEQSMFLVYAGLPRYADSIASSYKYDTGVVRQMRQAVDEAVPLAENGDIRALGKLLVSSWKLKQRLSKKVSTPYIDMVCEMALKAGAVGYKLCGAGGGGFILLLVEPDAQVSVKEAMRGFLIMPFRFESQGSKVIFNGGDDAS